MVGRSVSEPYQMIVVVARETVRSGMVWMDFLDDVDEIQFSHCPTFVWGAIDSPGGTGVRSDDSCSEGAAGHNKPGYSKQWTETVRECVRDCVYSPVSSSVKKTPRDRTNITQCVMIHRFFRFSRRDVPAAPKNVRRWDREAGARKKTSSVISLKYWVKILIRQALGLNAAKRAIDCTDIMHAICFPPACLLSESACFFPSYHYSLFSESACFPPSYHYCAYRILLE